jgi:hypothetical protein
MNNLYINKDLFIKHHNKEYRSDRINDFKDMHKILKTYLIPKERANINEKKLKKYVEMYKKENRELIRKVLQNVVHVSFKKFYLELKKQIDRFNFYLEDNSIKKYIFVLGVGNDGGASTTDFNLFKSNFWVFLLAWKHLKIKPYDIILNLNTAIRLYYPDIKDFLLLDDCSYSGDQMFNQVVKVASTEFLFFDKKGFVVRSQTENTVYEPVQEKLVKLHIIIPYLSSLAYNKIAKLDLTTAFDIIRYNSYIINPFSEVLDNKTLRDIDQLYQQFYKGISFATLIPIFFEHKIADSISTIDLILIKGQVLDDPKKRFAFIDACTYDKNKSHKLQFNPEIPNFNERKLYCPQPPYINFKKILLEKLK